MKLTYAFCTYNRCERLERLVAAMRAQTCPIPFEILAVNNNSSDDTLAVLAKLAAAPGVSLRYVTETQQGIVPARNRAVEEAHDSDILVFIDDDELPLPGTLDAACDAIFNEGAQCVGGKVKVDFAEHHRPNWLSDELLGFLAEVNHGDESFWIRESTTPIWTANIAYDMRLFRENPDLRFDARYNRVGADVGGGEDAMMFRALLSRGARIRYRPDMAVLHGVEPWRLQRKYFLHLHYRAGLRHGQFQLPAYERTTAGVPPFLIRQFAGHALKAAGMQILGRPGALRQAMNATHALGCLLGYRRRTAASRS